MRDALTWFGFEPLGTQTPKPEPVQWKAVLRRSCLRWVPFAIFYWECKFFKVCHFNLFCLSPVQLLPHLTLAFTLLPCFESWIDDFGNGSANKSTEFVCSMVRFRCFFHSLALSATGFIRVYFRLMGKSHKFICFGTYNRNSRGKSIQHPKINHRHWGFFVCSLFVSTYTRQLLAIIWWSVKKREEALFLCTLPIN